MDTKELKVEYYRVTDNCEMPIIYNDLEAALECIVDMLYGIDYDFPIEITRVKMTKEQYENLTEM